jgi:hypothetical protein
VHKISQKPDKAAGFTLRRQFCPNSPKIKNRQIDAYLPNSSCPSGGFSLR